MNRLRGSLALLSLGAILVSQLGASAQEPTTQKPAYLDPSVPRDERAKDLVSRMTTEEKASQLVHAAAAIPRLQVSAYNWWSEGLHGVGFDGIATVFPQAIGMAASWDPECFTGSRRPSAPKAVHATTTPCATAVSSSSRGSRSGRRTSTSFAIPAGGVGRKRTGKIRTSHRSWAWPSSRDCKAPTEVSSRRRHAEALRRPQRP